MKRNVCCVGFIHSFDIDIILKDTKYIRAYNIYQMMDVYEFVKRIENLIAKIEVVENV